MTIDQSGLFDVGSNATHARTIRALMGFVRAGGLLSAGDLQVTGDPSSMAVNIGTGCAFVPYSAPTAQYLEPFNVDAAESRSLATATGARVDLIYAAVSSMEFGNTTNFKDLQVITGPNGVTDTPDPDPTLAGSLPLAKIVVPAGATLGTHCGITMLASTTAPVRDGGYAVSDLSPASPTTWGFKLINMTIGAGGYGGYPHGAPFTPLGAMLVPQYPNDPSQGGWATFAPGNFHNDFCTATDVHGVWYDLSGNVAPEGANFSAYGFCWMAGSG